MSSFTIEDMKRFAVEAWGELGGNVVDAWLTLNKRYFRGELKPIPIVITNTQPFGRRLAFCSWGSAGRTITLNVPRQAQSLVADNGTLLHEMVHQHLNQIGEDATHASAAWRREIMRLQSHITGTHIWAGRSMVKRDPASKKVVRLNEPGEGGKPSLTQGAIARWPHDNCGINLGKLGTTPRQLPASK